MLEEGAGRVVGAVAFGARERRGAGSRWRRLPGRLVLASLLALNPWAPGAAVAQEGPGSAAGADAGGFIVRPGDVLQIRVWPDTALSGEFPVEESGLVYLPILGGLEAGGMPLGELRKVLRERYGEAMKAPVVTVTPLFRVSVLGAVQRPGLYQVDPSQTLFDVVSLAGGFREGAREDRIRVIRGDRVLEINAKRALETGEALLGLNLQSGDRIVVPERGWNIRPLDVFYFFQSLAVIVTLLSRL